MLIIIQARYSSNRLPGKVLKKINQKPLLKYMTDSISKLNNKHDLVVATSLSESDDQVVSFCKENNVNFYRGNLRNVSKRFQLALKNYQGKYFMRLCADSPLISKFEIDRFIDFSKNNNHDLITNRYCNYPKGQTIEVIKTKIFNKFIKYFSTEEDYEHVTNYFYKLSGKFDIKYIYLNKSMQDINLAVDTYEDFDEMKKLISIMKNKRNDYSLNEIVRLYKKLK